MLGEFTGIDFQFDQATHRFQGISKKESSSFDGSEQIRDHWKTASLHVCEEKCGAASSVDPALNLSSLQIRINLGFDSNQMPMPLEILDTFLKTAVTHKKLSHISNVGQVCECCTNTETIDFSSNDHSRKRSSDHERTAEPDFRKNGNAQGAEIAEQKA